MIVKVMIKRKIKEGKAREVFALLNKFRSEAMNQKGYITGETLINHDNPREILVIAMCRTWKIGSRGEKIRNGKPMKHCWRGGWKNLLLMKVMFSVRNMLNLPNRSDRYNWIRVFFSVTEQ